MSASTRSRAATALGSISLVLGLLAAMLTMLAAPALADGDGSPPDCLMQESVPGGVITAPEGQIVTAICIKAGQFHSEVITTDGVQSGTYVKNQNEPNDPYSYTVSGIGTGSVTVTQNDGPGISHLDYTLRTPEPSASLSGECETASVTIDNDGDVGYSVDVFINGDFLETISASKDYTLTEGQTLTTSETGEDSVTYEDCSEPEPSVTLSAACDETQPTATVTIDNDGDETFSVEVFIDNASQGVITETQTFEADAESVLRVEYGEGESDDITFLDCSEGDSLLSSAEFTTGTECSENLPAVTYDATVSETADDPIGDITLTVTDANGVERATRTFSATAADSIQLPTALEGQAVNVSWDFDDTTLQQTLASGCAEVQGITDEQDPPASTDTETEEEPAALPATQVKGEQVASGGELPNTGAEHVILLLLAGSFLALGGSMLLMGDPRRGVAS